MAWGDDSGQGFGVLYPDGTFIAGDPRTDDLFVGDDDEIYYTTTQAPRTASAQELADRIPFMGSLLVSGDSSELQIAQGNPDSFNVERDAGGQYRISNKTNWLLMGGIAAVALVVVSSLMGGRKR